MRLLGLIFTWSMAEYDAHLYCYPPRKAATERGRYAVKALSDNKQTTINLITSLAAFVINAGISFVLTPYILEKLGNEAYGFIGLAYDFVNYAGILTLALNSMSCRFVSYSTTGAIKKRQIFM